MADTTVVTARIGRELSGQLDQLAERLDRSRAWVIQQAIRRYVSAEIDLLDFVQIGIDAADRGDFVSQEDMEAWFASRGLRAAAE
jgi:predicted transcriptional regulator